MYSAYIQYKHIFVYVCTRQCSCRRTSAECWWNVILDMITAAANLWDRAAVCNISQICLTRKNKQALPMLSVQRDLSPAVLATTTLLSSMKLSYIFCSYSNSYLFFLLFFPCKWTRLLFPVDSVVGGERCHRLNSQWSDVRLVFQQMSPVTSAQGSSITQKVAFAKRRVTHQTARNIVKLSALFVLAVVVPSGPPLSFVLLSSVQSVLFPYMLNVIISPT